MTLLLQLLLQLLVCMVQRSHAQHSQADPAKFLVYGPGLEAPKALPVRYVFVQVCDTEGRFTDDHMPPPERHDPHLRLELHTSGQSQRPVRHYSETLKLNAQGLYVLRYRLLEPVTDAALSITYFGMPVAQSPYRLRGQAVDDKCECPQLDIKDWMLYHSCATNSTQIYQDFKRFKAINMPIVMQEASRRFNNPGAYAFCRYIIKQNVLYRKCFGKHTGFTFMSDPMLLSLLRKMKMPDLDFILNLGDWPLSDLRREPHLPIISWCGSSRTADIVMPTYEMSEATINMMDRVYNDVFRIMHDSLRHPWSGKVDKAFFRGRDSNERRLQLVRKSVKEPNSIDARLTNMFFFKKTPDLGGTVKHIPMGDFFQFKYQISIDGTVAAYRLPLLLAGGSTVLKQDSQYYEHFYRDLQPDKHFVTLKEDLSDLDEKLEWLRSRDGVARRIADNARNFVLEHLLPENMLCYQAAVLLEYAARLRSDVTLPEGFEMVPQPGGSDCKCQFSPKDEL